MMDLIRRRLVAPFLAEREEASTDTSLIYHSLQPREIRVVTLAPGEWGYRLQCTLKVVSLDDNPPYETLSYVWGDPKAQKKPIFLQKQIFHVTPNLESALRHLRHQDLERTIWIDAICINQEDMAERAVEVDKMRFIYARTSHLIIWVGEASEDSDLGMETFRQVGEVLKEGSHWDVDLANVSFIEKEGIKAFKPKPWVAINNLLRRDWFERVWVIQEVCMPDAQMSFVCGPRSVPWGFVSRVSHALQRYRWGPERTFALFRAGYDPIDMDFPVNLVREIWKNQASIAESECTLLKQLWHFKSRKCGDARDKVFAILGICKDVNSGDITVDYSNSTSISHVYSEVSKFIIMRDREVKLLSACQSYGSEINDLPSWAPDWSIDARFRPRRPISNWVGDDQRDIFNASGGFSARVEISVDFRTMTARGLPTGKISVLGTHLGNDGHTEETPASQERMFTLFKEWWPFAKTHTPEFTPNGERRVDAFWRTIITDINSLSQKATRSEETARFPSRMASWDPKAPDSAPGEAPQQFMDFLASFQQATRNRRFFITEEGNMGLGPRLTKPGDFVCVLLGSQVPFILRAVDDYHVLIGECYCHGFMEGEAVQGLDEDKVVLQDFNLK